jgi:hypothetical protein
MGSGDGSTMGVDVADGLITTEGAPRGVVGVAVGPPAVSVAAGESDGTAATLVMVAVGGTPKIGVMPAAGAMSDPAAPADRAGLLAWPKMLPGAACSVAVG